MHKGGPGLTGVGPGSWVCGDGLVRGSMGPGLETGSPGYSWGLSILKWAWRLVHRCRNGC